MDTVLYALWHVAAAWLVLAMPVVGIWSYRRFLRRVSSDPRARERMYLWTICEEWLWMAIVAVLLLKTPAPFSSIGLRWPVGDAGGMCWAVLGGGLAGLLLPALLSRSARYRDRVSRGLQQLSAFLPATNKERWLWAGVALTAGVCEEIMFRGFLTLYVIHYLPSLHPALVAVVTGIIFGLVHAYQGWKGIALTGLLGVVLGLVYWQAGSLIPGIVFHFIVDFRVLLVWRGPAGPKSMPSEPGAAEPVLESGHDRARHRHE